VVITKQRIAKTILALINSGRRMPQVVVPENPGKVPTVEDTLRTTVDLWYSLYGEKVSPERWAAAERIALTMPSPQGVPQNIISSALMGEALRKAQGEYISEQQSAEPIKIEPSKNADYQTKLMWRWTLAKLAEGREITPYLPTSAECLDYGRSLGLSDSDVYKQMGILKIYLNDYKYAQVSKTVMAFRLVAVNKQLRFLPID